jgi:hypothetical protein
MVKQQILLPVSKLSRRILAYQYSAFPCLPHGNDYLHTLLTFDSSSRATTEPCSLLTELVEVDLPVKKYIGKIDVAVVGKLLHDYHVQLVMTYINSRVEMNFSKEESIRSVIEKYKIEDSDWSFDAISKKNQRFSKKNVKKLPIKSVKGVQKVGNDFKQKRTLSTIYNEGYLSKEINKIIELYPSLVKNKLGRINRAKMKAIRAYVYSDIGGYRTRFIANKLSLPERTTRHMIARIRLFIKNN